MYEISVFGRGITTWTAASAADAAHKAKKLLGNHYCVLIQSPHASGAIFVTREGIKRNRS